MTVIHWVVMSIKQHCQRWPNSCCTGHIESLVQIAYESEFHSQLSISVAFVDNGDVYHIPNTRRLHFVKT